MTRLAQIKAERDEANIRANRAELALHAVCNSIRKPLPFKRFKVDGCQFTVRFRPGGVPLVIVEQRTSTDYLDVSAYEFDWFRQHVASWGPKSPDRLPMLQALDALMFETVDPYGRL
jgi:hypothetical protein